MRKAASHHSVSPLQIIKDGAEHEDLTEVAKLFELHPSAAEEGATTN